MFIYIIIAILITLLALTFPKMNEKSKSLAICLAVIVLFVLAAFRGSKVDQDYIWAYGFFIRNIPDARFMFRDFAGFLNRLPPPELSFCVLVALVKSVTTYVMPVVAVVYAFFAVPTKLNGIRKLTNDDIFGFALLFYFANLFLLHEMTQIRAGLATGIFLCAIPAIYQRQLSKYVCMILIASLIHRSTMIAMPLYFLGCKGINFKLWFGVTLGLLFLAFVRYDVISFILDYDVPILHHKLVIYMAMQDWLKFKVNLFNVFILLQLAVSVLLYWKRELITPHCPYFYFLLKLNLLSVIVFYFFSRIPVFAFRLNDFLGCCTIILYPLIYYVIKPRAVSQLVLVCMAWGILLINLFHNKLLNSYYMVFFD